MANHTPPPAKPAQEADTVALPRAEFQQLLAEHKALKAKIEATEAAKNGPQAGDAGAVAKFTPAKLAQWEATRPISKCEYLAFMAFTRTDSLFGSYLDKETGKHKSNGNALDIVWRKWHGPGAEFQDRDALGCPQSRFGLAHVNLAHNSKIGYTVAEMETFGLTGPEYRDGAGNLKPRSGQFSLTEANAEFIRDQDFFPDGEEIRSLRDLHGRFVTMRRGWTILKGEYASHFQAQATQRQGLDPIREDAAPQTRTERAEAFASV